MNRPPDPIHIVLASTNPGKMREIETFLTRSGLSVRVTMPADLEEVEETGTTFMANACLKVKAATVGDDVDYILAEDSGFEVTALNGLYGLDPFPGIRSSRWMTEEVRQSLLGIDADFQTTPLTYEHINAGILKLLEDQQNRQARYVAAFIMTTPDHTPVFEGHGDVPLQVIDDPTPRGENGFGYDPIVSPEAYPKRTMAELSTTEKNDISHRGVVLRELVRFLDTQQR